MQLTIRAPQCNQFTSIVVAVRSSQGRTTSDRNAADLKRTFGRGQHHRFFPQVPAQRHRRQTVTGALKNEDFRVVLPTREAQQSVKFALARYGNQNAVVISKLAKGSSAATAGVRPGQRLLAISDPMRGGDSTLWHLNDRPSMRFVRDALSMRSGDSITFILSRESMLEPAGERSQSAAASDSSEAAAAVSSFDPALFDDASNGAASPAADDSALTCSQDKQTIRQKLQAEWSQNAEESQAQQTAFERRQQRRKDFFQQESKRDDGGLILTVAAVVLLPAIGILAFAYFSGYLDTLSDGYTTYR